MKRLLPKALLVLSMMLASQAPVNAQEFTRLNHGNYARGTMAPGEWERWTYKVPANTAGFFTLKNKGGRSDFDIYVYVRRNSTWVPVGKGELAGQRTELLVMDMAQQEQEFYVLIGNRGRSTSEYNMHADYVNPLTRLISTALENSISAALANGEDPTTTENIDRAVAGLSSVAQGSNLSNLGKDLALREVTSYARRQFGYGWFGEWMVDYSVSVISGFFRYY